METWPTTLLIKYLLCYNDWLYYKLIIYLKRLDNIKRQTYEWNNFISIKIWYNKKYANWLKNETSFTCLKTKSTNINEIIKYDIIILGGGIYASGIAGLSFIKKNFNKLKDKKIIIFCCGASLYEENALKQIKERNLKDKMSNIPLFYCRGAFYFDNMSFKDRVLCNLLKKVVAKKSVYIWTLGKSLNRSFW